MTLFLARRGRILGCRFDHLQRLIGDGNARRTDAAKPCGLDVVHRGRGDMRGFNQDEP